MNTRARSQAPEHGCSSCVRRPARVTFVTTAEALRALTSRTALAGTLELRLPYLSDTENARWARRLRTAYSACGCESGAIAGIGTLVLLALYGLPPIGIEPVPGWLRVLTGLLIVSMATLLGKLLGIMLARAAARYWIGCLHLRASETERQTLLETEPANTSSRGVSQ
jgi:hypothetical protein